MFIQRICSVTIELSRESDCHQKCVEEDSVDILGYSGKKWLRLVAKGDGGYNIVTEFMMSFEGCDEKGILLVLAFKLGILATRLLTC